MNDKTVKDMSSFEIEIPASVANMQLPLPELLDYYTRRDNREILWNNEIEDSFVEIYQDILNWNKEDIDAINKGEKTKDDLDEIKIFINSDGGSVSAVFSIIDLISLSVTPVTTIGLGKVYSSGGLLLMAGHKRLLLPSATLLIHDGYSGSSNSVGKMIDSLEFTKEQEFRIKDYILSRTSIPADEYDDNYRKDWWIFADESVEKYHIADKVITDITEIL